VELLTITVGRRLFVFFYNGGIVDHHCLERLGCFVDIGGIVGHHCLEVILFFILVELLTITVVR
jgi:hypothetical protein